MRARELDWRKLPVPETPQQKINYSNMCQSFFVDALAQSVALSTSLVEVEGTGRIEPPRFLTTNEMMSLPQSASFPHRAERQRDRRHGLLDCIAATATPARGPLPPLHQVAHRGRGWQRFRHSMSPP